MKLNHATCLFLVIFGFTLLSLYAKWSKLKFEVFSTLRWPAVAKVSRENEEALKSLQSQLPVLKHVCNSLQVPESLPGHPEVSTEDKSNDMMMNILNSYVRAMDASSENTKPHDNELRVCRLMHDINQLMPNVTFTHRDTTTCAKKSRLTIVNPRDRYFIGDTVIVHLDMYDFLGNRKTYGGDLLRARIHSPDLQAAASGKVTDFHNGTYHVQFTFFWEGKVKISLLLIHPSEAVAALWRARNTGYDHVTHKAKYTSPTKTVETKCGYQLDTQEEVCDYMSKKDEYPFYCIKPVNMSCSSLTQVGSYFGKRSYLSALEMTLFDSDSFLTEIPHGLKDLVIENRTGHTTIVTIATVFIGDSLPVMESCKMGMKLQHPGGHFFHNLWHPAPCTMRWFTDEEVTGCLRGKNLHLIGDSRIKHWFERLTSKVKSLKELDLYDWGWQKSRLMVDPNRNIRIKFQKHGDPFVALDFCSVLENPTIAEEIDRIGGNKHTVIAFTIGTHFKRFPLHLYIRRVMNIRRALQRLLLRSPETKVVVKTENIGFRANQKEVTNDLHGYTNYLIMSSMLRDLHVGIVNSWDISTALSLTDVHAPPHVIENEINLFLTFIC